MHTKDHFLTASTKDEKWLVLVGRPSLAASRWRARRFRPTGLFSYIAFAINSFQLAVLKSP